MTESEQQITALPQRPWFQFGLATLLSVFVVLASSLAVFGAGGLVVFVLVIGLAAFVYNVASLSSLGILTLIVLCSTCLLLPAVRIPSFERAVGRVVCEKNLKQIAMALQQYHVANCSFPPAYVADNAGKLM